jgi:uncharacterized RDD family membrane protein YckC
MAGKTAHPAWRFLAWLIDWQLGLIIGLALGLVVAQAGTIMALLNNALAVVLWGVIIFPLIWPVILGLLTSRLGGGPGKIVCGLAIVDRQGKYLSFWLALFRTYVGYLVSGLLVWLGFVWILVDKERQAWHDKVCGSWVIVRSKTGWLLGLVILLSLVIVNIALATNIFTEINLHSGLYQELFQSVNIK